MEVSPNKLRALLIENGIKQIDIASSCGVSSACIAAVIAGRGRSLRIEQAIAESLGLSYETIWGEKPRVRKAA